jgi:hypothetical protein
LLINNLNDNDVKILNINDLNAKNFKNESDDYLTDKNMEDADSDNGDDDDDDDIDMIETFDIEEIDSEDDEKVITNPIVDINEIKISENKTNTNHIEYLDNSENDFLANLEKSKSIEMIDYKKLSLNKLKSVVLDKGLATDTSRMKKNDLLKLLGVE